MVSVVENRLELALSQYCNKENPNHQIDNSQRFAMKTLECFPHVQSVNSGRFMSLIDADFLSYYQMYITSHCPYTNTKSIL